MVLSDYSTEMFKLQIYKIILNWMQLDAITRKKCFGAGVTGHLCNHHSHSILKCSLTIVQPYFDHSLTILNGRMMVEIWSKWRRGNGGNAEAMWRECGGRGTERGEREVGRGGWRGRRRVTGGGWRGRGKSGAKMELFVLCQKKIVYLQNKNNPHKQAILFSFNKKESSMAY